MGLSRSIVSPKRTARLLQQFTQSCGGYAVVEFSGNHQIRPLLALVLAEFAREAHRRIQSLVFHMLVDDGQIFGVPSRETGTSQANHNFD
jgi:hypothetical protein